ncbi:MAG TPA: glutamate-cysteine ligase family protein [Longimicrobiaceae bacterium]|nr:glutamate-cysteine ligase family protein [Longimicrobiaceae bacterium]
MTLAPPLAAPTLLADLRGRAFGIGAPGRPRRIGAEVELLALRADTRAPAPIVAPEGPATLPLLRRHAARHGWTERGSPYGPPCFVLPDGGVVSWEPGGQVELSAPPFASASELLSSLRSAMVPLRAAAREEGIELLALGIDPVNPAEAVPLQLRGARYLRMAEHFARLGPDGARMMRQTASVQVNLDWPADPLPLWRLLNAAAPYLTATFANSPVYAGAHTGHRSTRAHAWRGLDPGRTGAFRRDADPAAGYLRFALGAPAILLPWPAGEAIPAGEWVARGEMTAAEWATHLTTLFPEVRPKGYAEVRSVDAIDPEWYAAPLALLSGIAYHPEGLRAAAELLGDPDPELLRRAGREGLGDEEIARTARDLFAIGLEGAAALGEAYLSAADLETALEFYRRYTRRGLALADDASPAAPA